MLLSIKQIDNYLSKVSKKIKICGEKTDGLMLYLFLKLLFGSILLLGMFLYIFNDQLSVNITYN